MLILTACGHFQKNIYSIIMINDKLKPRPNTCKDCGTRSLQVRVYSKYKVNLCFVCFSKRSLIDFFDSSKG